MLWKAEFPVGLADEVRRRDARLRLDHRVDIEMTPFPVKPHDDVGEVVQQRPEAILRFLQGFLRLFPLLNFLQQMCALPREKRRLAPEMDDCVARPPCNHTDPYRCKLGGNAP